MRPDGDQHSLTETARVRDEAHGLLNQLVLERNRSERLLAGAGRPDPIKSVTGRSAMDHAVDETREVIRRVDGLLARERSTMKHPEATTSPMQVASGAW